MTPPEYSFPSTDKSAWEQAALIEWRGERPSAQLFTGADDIRLQPYYDASDLPPGVDPVIPVATDEFSDAREWFNMPLVKVADVSQANAEALQFLNSGADGILFELSAIEDPASLL